MPFAPQSRSHSRSQSRPRARAPRPPTAIPTPDVPLAGPEEALRLFLAAVSEPPRHENIAGLLATVGEREPTFGALVLATCRPGHSIELLPDDEAAFYRLRHDLAEVR